SAAFVAKTKNNNIPIVVKTPCCSTSWILSAICAMFTVPRTEYKKATAVTNTTDENKLINTYFNDSLNCTLSPPKTMSAYEAINSTSKNTNRLNKSPVKNAPDTPEIKKKKNA